MTRINHLDFRPTVEMIKEIELFKALTDSELKEMLSAGTTSFYEVETNVIIEGDVSWGLYLIIEGTVSVLKTNKMNGVLYEVGQLGRGSFFGEMSFLDESPRSATVKTLTDARLFYLSKDSFSKILERSTDIQLRFYLCSLKALVKRLRDLDDNYVISQYQLWQSVLKKEMSVS